MELFYEKRCVSGFWIRLCQYSIAVKSYERFIRLWIMDTAIVILARLIQFPILSTYFPRSVIKDFYRKKSLALNFQHHFTTSFLRCIKSKVAFPVCWKPCGKNENERVRTGILQYLTLFVGNIFTDFSGTLHTILDGTLDGWWIHFLLISRIWWTNLVPMRLHE